MKRLEKVNNKTVNDINNGNGSQLTKSIFENFSKSFRINSVEIVEDFMLDDMRNSLDDDVFLEKEKEFISNTEDFHLPPAPLDNSSFSLERSSLQADEGSNYETRYPRDNEKSNDETKKESGKTGRPRRASDVIDSWGDDSVYLRPPAESGGIAIVTPRSRASSDLGYSGSFTSTSSATSFSFPPNSYIMGGGKTADITDSRPFTETHGGSSESVPIAIMPTDRDADEYNMLHPRRGRAIIINNDEFDNNLARPRKGSLVDVRNLEEEFYKLGFEVTVIYNPTHQELKEYMYEVSQEDHRDADCLMVAVLTHGMDDGWLFARDALYKVDTLWQPFTADKCLSLAGKPKIFFVQACRGKKFDPGVKMVSHKGSVSEPDAAASEYQLPSHSDFLIAYSVTDGFYSWRNPEEGTWFIQSLVQELKLNGSEVNFLTLLTRVNRRVAVHYSSYNEDVPWLDKQKQVPTFQSTLIRDLVFKPKKVV